MTGTCVGKAKFNRRALSGGCHSLRPCLHEAADWGLR